MQKNKFILFIIIVAFIPFCINRFKNNKKAASSKSAPTKYISIK